MPKDYGWAEEYDGDDFGFGGNELVSTMGEKEMANVHN
jgi:hypothetical protein